MNKHLFFPILTVDDKSRADTVPGRTCDDDWCFARCSQPKLSSAEEMKAKLLQLLLTHSHSLLIESGCPIEKVCTVVLLANDILQCTYLYLLSTETSLL